MKFKTLSSQLALCVSLLSAVTAYAVKPGEEAPEAAEAASQAPKRQVTYVPSTVSEGT